jgi:hypothetical protein
MTGMNLKLLLNNFIIIINASLVSLVVFTIVTIEEKYNIDRSKKPKFSLTTWVSSNPTSNPNKYADFVFTFFGTKL